MDERNGMTIQLAERMQELRGEGALDVFTRARAREARGQRIAHLELGEPDFPTPAHVVEAAVRSLEDGDTRYGPPAGTVELREAIAAAFQARGIPAVPEQVVITPGAKPMLFYSVLALVEPGDEVLVPNPGFPIYPSAVRFAGGIPVFYGVTTAGIDLDEIAALVTPRTRVIILNSPHNPTGCVIELEVLEELAGLVMRHQLSVISDEVYARITYAGPPSRAPSPAAIGSLRERTIVVDSFSKWAAMTGWRLGYGLLPPAIVERITTLAVNGHTCVPTFVQRAGVAALTGPCGPAEEILHQLHARRKLLVDGLSRLPGVRCATPRGAFYAYPDVSELLERLAITTDALASRLLDQGVATLSGTAFGDRGDGFLRLSFGASPKVIAEALTGIRHCVALNTKPEPSLP